MRPFGVASILILLPLIACGGGGGSALPSASDPGAGGGDRLVLFADPGLSALTQYRGTDGTRATYYGPRGNDGLPLAVEKIEMVSPTGDVISADHDTSGRPVRVRVHGAGQALLDWSQPDRLRLLFESFDGAHAHQETFPVTLPPPAAAAGFAAAVQSGAASAPAQTRGTLSVLCRCGPTCTPTGISGVRFQSRFRPTGSDEWFPLVLTEAYDPDETPRVPYAYELPIPGAWGAEYDELVQQVDEVIDRVCTGHSWVKLVLGDDYLKLACKAILNPALTVVCQGLRHVLEFTCELNDRMQDLGASGGPATLVRDLLRVAVGDDVTYEIESVAEHGSFGRRTFRWTRDVPRTAPAGFDLGHVDQDVPDAGPAIGFHKLKISYIPDRCLFTATIKYDLVCTQPETRVDVIVFFGEDARIFRGNGNALNEYSGAYDRPFTECYEEDQNPAFLFVPFKPGDYPHVKDLHSHAWSVLAPTPGKPGVLTYRIQIRAAGSEPIYVSVPTPGL